MLSHQPVEDELGLVIVAPEGNIVGVAAAEPAFPIKYGSTCFNQAVLL